MPLRPRWTPVLALAPTLLLGTTPLEAQFLPADELRFLTAEWEGERMPDGFDAHHTPSRHENISTRGHGSGASGRNLIRRRLRATLRSVLVASSSGGRRIVKTRAPLNR